jgi:predicted ArsR family transcriptional regulator
MARESILDPANPGADRTKDRVLLTLKSRGPLSTSVLARLLGISIPGVRQHLNSLTREGLIQHQTIRKGVGRPAHEWALTPAAQDRFPDTHAEMTTSLIASIRDTLGEPALDAVIDHRHQQIRKRYRAQLEAASTLDEKLARLASIRTEEGYMAELTAMEDGSWLLAENHCPICAAAAG